MAVEDRLQQPKPEKKGETVDLVDHFNSVVTVLTKYPRLPINTVMQCIAAIPDDPTWNGCSTAASVATPTSSPNGSGAKDAGKRSRRYSSHPPMQAHPLAWYLEYHECQHLEAEDDNENWFA